MDITDIGAFEAQFDALCGDADGDGDVDLADLLELAVCLSTPGNAVGARTPGGFAKDSAHPHTGSAMAPSVIRPAVPDGDVPISVEIRGAGIAG